MHLSTHNWMRAEPLGTTLKRIKEYGYESIEISGEPAQYDVKETRTLLKEHGIRCWGAVTLTLGERNLAAKDEGQRARSVDYVKSVITMVSEFDGEIITLVPATVGKVVPDATEQEEWKWVVDATRECFAHDGEFHQLLAVGFNIGADIENDGVAACHRGPACRQGGAMHTFAAE